MKKILITGAGGAPAVNFINSLRMSCEDMYLVGTDMNKYHLEWPNLNKAYLSPYESSHPKYINFLNDIIKKEKIEFIHAQPDCEVRTLSENRKRINAKILLPNKRTIDICQNKFTSANIWEKTGIHTVKTYLINNILDIKRVGKILNYPYWMRASSGAGGRGSTKVDNLDMAIHWFGYWKARNVDWVFIAQRFLDGRDFAFQSLWNNGKLIVSQARERLEYIYPYLAPSRITGTPAVARTVFMDSINKIATSAITAIDKKATGIFCVDMKEDNLGQIYPTEINCGRFFTTSQFFSAAGVNMPYYYVKLAYNEDLPKLQQYNSVKENVYWIRHIDCPAVLIRNEKFKADESYCKKI